MIFKRFLYTAVAFFMGLGLGILGAPALIPRFALPNTYGGVFIIAIPCALLMAIAVYLLTGRLYSAF